MTIDDVRVRLAKVKAYADIDDDEYAHAEQDDLIKAVLEDLAPTHELAAEVLKVYDIDFHRWCA